MMELIIFASHLLLLDLTLVKKYAGVDIASIRQSGEYTTYPSAPGISAQDSSRQPSTRLPLKHRCYSFVPFLRRLQLAVVWSPS